MPDNQSSDTLRDHHRELVWNQIWETLNTVAKVAFFGVMTPLMLKNWGPERFGLFAIANSSVAFYAVLDCGIRALTRVSLSNPHLSSERKMNVLVLHLLTFGMVVTMTSLTAIFLAWLGCWGRWLHLPPEGDLVMAATTILAGMTMFLLLLLEPLAAAGRLSQIKAAAMAGNMLALPTVSIALAQGAGVLPVTMLYLVSLSLPSLFLLPAASLRSGPFWKNGRKWTMKDHLQVLHTGGWYNTINLAWLMKGHGLTLVVTAVGNPAQAGVFFIYLKLSELLSVLGASTSEPTIAAIASTDVPAERAQRFETSYTSAVALCLAGCAALGFFCDRSMQIWLGHGTTSVWSGLFIGLFGVMAAWNRMIAAASLGMRQPRPAALGNLCEAIFTILAALFFYARFGVDAIFAAGIPAAICLIPAARSIAGNFEKSPAAVWLEPVTHFLPRLGWMLLAGTMALFSHQIGWSLVAAFCFIALALDFIFRLHFARTTAHSR